MSSRILKGVRVLDLSRMLSGPYCTMMLADHGAEVIKIESATGDTSRTNGPYRDDDPEKIWAGYFVSLNRGKKSVELDLKSKAGAESFRKLAATADVIVENFRPGVMDRLGLSYESLAEENPRLVYAAIRGFGDPRTGQSPYGNWPSYDVVAQAMGGLMAITGPTPDIPTKVGPGIGDIFTGLMMSFGILGALREAEATGKGQFVDVSMYDAIISLCERAVYQYDITNVVPKPEGNGHPLLAPFGLFPSTDGFIALGIVEDAFWQKLCDIMGQPELGQDPKFATRGARSQNAEEVNAIVSAWTSGLEKTELTQSLGGQVPYGPMNTIADIFSDPHVAARNMLARVPHPETDKEPWTVAANPVRYAGQDPVPLAPPPRLGEHNGLTENVEDTQVMDDAAKRDLRHAFGQFATGVTIITTTEADGTPRGFTANSFSSVSLDPPLLLVCIAKAAHSCDVFAEAEHFAVNVLSDEQKEISGLFATQSPDKFDIASWQPDETSVPLLNGTLANFVCARHKLVDAGDHLVLIGKVLSHSSSDREPLGYFRGAYFSLGLEDPLADAAAAGGLTSIGALLTKGHSLLLEETDGGRWHVPKASIDTNTVEGLVERLGNVGITSKLNHLYAVYRDSQNGKHSIVYHGVAKGRARGALKYFELDSIPLESIATDAERSMLQRYQRERRHGSFGIYHGDEVEGVVHELSEPTPSVI